MSIRVEMMLIRVIPPLYAIDFTTRGSGQRGSRTITVPSTDGRRELRMRTGIFFCTAGVIVDG